ncbi:hypothetical protein ACVIW2_005925 [Bradyrhizobium huanghuaihaiense]
MSKKLKNSVAGAAVACAIAGAGPALARPADGIDTFYADPGTEHKLSTSVGLGNDKVCLTAVDAVTGATILARYRRSLNGNPKELDQHHGRKCFFSKPGVYVLYGTPIGTRTKFLVEHWKEGPPPPRTDAGGSLKPRSIPN